MDTHINWERTKTFDRKPHTFYLINKQKYTSSLITVIAPEIFSVTGMSTNSYNYRPSTAWPWIASGAAIEEEDVHWGHTRVDWRRRFDVPGFVVEVGADVKDRSIGGEVYGKGARDEAGALAEYFTIDTNCIALKPTTLSFEEASGVPGASLTSYQVLTEQVRLLSGERLLVLSGSTTYEIFAIQYAKQHGAHVVATTRTKNVCPVHRSKPSD